MTALIKRAKRSKKKKELEMNELKDTHPLKDTYLSKFAFHPRT